MVYGGVVLVCVLALSQIELSLIAPRVLGGGTTAPKGNVFAGTNDTVVLKKRLNDLSNFLSHNSEAAQDKLDTAERRIRDLEVI